MKVTCERDKLLAAFQIAAAVVPARSPKPILQNVKFETTKDGAVLTATDLEVGVRVQVAGVTPEAAGTVLLNVTRFGSILRESGDPTLKIESDGRGTVVRGERSEFRLPAENPDEYPAVADFTETAYWELPARLLRELIRRTVFATDNESSRYALGGVLLEYNGNKLTAVGTDGRRLAVMEGPTHGVNGYKGSDGMTIVPTRAMNLIERSLADGDAEVQVVARGNDLLVRTPRVVVYSRLVEGRFPKWRDVFPKRDNVQKISMVVGPTYSAVRQAAIVTSEESRGVDLTFGDGKVVLAGRAAEAGQSRVELPIAYDGPAITIALDPKYLSEFFRVLDGEKNFTLELKDGDSAAICSTDDGYGYVIMPLAREIGSSMPDARRIADILSELESRRGYARTKSSESLAEAWQATAGEPTASHSRVGEVRRGTLEVIVANSMLAQELQFEKQRLLTQLIERLPDHKLRDLRFRVGAVK